MQMGSLEFEPITARQLVRKIISSSLSHSLVMFLCFISMIAILMSIFIDTLLFQTMRQSVKRWLTMAAILAMTLLSRSAEVIVLRGAGASFPSAVYKDWLSSYELSRRQFVELITSYDAVGSGKGKQRIMGKMGPPVEYGASDVPLTEEEHNAYSDLQMIPTMAG